MQGRDRLFRKSWARRATFALRSRASFAAAVWDWTPLERDLPRRMRFSDLDGILVLPGGVSLVLEGKRADVLRPPRIPSGQMRALRDLAGTGLFTVFLLGGRPPCEVFWIRELRKGVDSGWQRTTSTAVKARIIDWIKTHDQISQMGGGAWRSSET